MKLSNSLTAYIAKSKVMATGLPLSEPYSGIEIDGRMSLSNLIIGETDDGVVIGHVTGNRRMRMRERRRGKRKRWRSMLRRRRRVDMTNWRVMMLMWMVMMGKMMMLMLMMEMKIGVMMIVI